MRYRYMSSAGQVGDQISIPEGQAIAGNAIGILVLALWYPLLPGNVANATTFEFPVCYKVLRGTSIPQIISADPALLDVVIKGGKELEKHGVRAVVGSCGYFANYQKEVAKELEVPTFLSSLLQIPIIKQALKPDQKVGIICADDNALTVDTLSACGVDNLSDIAIAGAQNLPEFQNILRCSGRFNSAKLEHELVNLAKQFISKNPDIGALLLECTDMPPYARSIQNASGLAVFDYITLINWIYGAVVRQPFAGFM